MARKKAEKFEYVPKLNCYRKRVKDTDGKYVAIYAKSQKEMRQKLAQVQVELQEATFRREHPTLREYAEKWLLMKSSSVQGSTLHDYENVVRCYIVKPLGDKYLTDITSDDVQMAMLDVAGMSASVYRKTQMLFKQIFTSARKARLIDVSPCEDLNPKGGKSADEKVALTDEQVKTLLDAVHGTPVYPFCMLALYAGLRREEILALKWDCVHLQAAAPYLDVKRVWSIDHNRPVIEDRTKSPAGMRSIPLPANLQECLKDLKSTNDSEFVISNSDGQPLSGTQWQRLWKYVQTRTAEPRVYYRYINGVRTKHTLNPKLGEKAPHNNKVVYSIDFHCTPHQLRHTYITNLIRAGVDVKTTQYLAGHENAKVTMDIYAHFVYNRPEDLASKVMMAFPTE